MLWEQGKLCLFAPKSFRCSMQNTDYMAGKSGATPFSAKAPAACRSKPNRPKNYHGLIKYTMFWHEAPRMVVVVAEHYGTEIGSKTKKSF
jgi:hypothetical protein